MADKTPEKSAIKAIPAVEVTIVGADVVCSCGTKMDRSNTPGYWLCPKCSGRFYGDLGHQPRPVACIVCGRVYPEHLKFCPNCGLSKEASL